jgi:hypothetical protein
LSDLGSSPDVALRAHTGTVLRSQWNSSANCESQVSVVLFSFVLGFELRASHLLGRCSTA